MVDKMKNLAKRTWQWMRINPVLAAVGVLVLTGVATTGAISATPLALGSSASLTQYGVPTTSAPKSSVMVTHTSARTLGLGRSFFDTAVVSSPASAPTGSVQFYLCGPTTADSTCSPKDAVPLGSGPVTLITGPLDSSTAISAKYTPARSGVYCFASVFNPAAGSGYVPSEDNITSPAQASECVDVVSPKLSVIKSSDPPTGSKVLRGQLVTYKLNLSNAGSGLVSDETVIDRVPTGTIYVPGSATCGSDPHCSVKEVSSTGLISWTGVDVAPATGGTPGTTILSFEVHVSPGDANNQVISNTAFFANDGTPKCTTATCATNKVTLTVEVPAVKVIGVTLPLKPVVKAVTPPLTPVLSVTTIHTGKAWAGSRPFEMAGIGLGLLLIALGLIRRRRILRGVANSPRI